MRTGTYPHTTRPTCIEGAGRRRPDGYRQVTVGLQSRRKHVLAWERNFGPVPPGCVVMHACDNPGCVYPGHLMVGTREANNVDAAQKGRTRNGPFRQLPGEQHPMARLTWPIVREIRRRVSSETQRSLAREFGISDKQMWKIVHDRAWRLEHEPMP